MLNYGKQYIDQEDINAVIDVLKSDFLTQGPKLPEFEKLVSNYCGAKYGVAVSNATSALHLACLALEVAKGDLVWTSAISFVASANCARYCSAKVDFVDIDARTFNICPYKLAEKLKFTKLKNKPLPKVVVVVHMCGQPCQMQAINKLSKEYGFKIIEDASHAIGSFYDSTPTGSCQYSDITIFSFHPVKIITTGEGGIALTNNKSIADKMLLYRSHGVIKDSEKLLKNYHGDWYYEQSALGFNYRLTDIQAALGISQMKKLDLFVKERNEKAKHYEQLLINDCIEIPHISANCYSSFHLYVVRMKTSTFKENKKKIFSKLRADGIGVQVHYIPIYYHPYYQKLGFKKGQCPEAENYYTEALTLPLYPKISFEEQNRVAASLTKVLSTYSLQEDFLLP